MNRAILVALAVLLLSALPTSQAQEEQPAAETVAPVVDIFSMMARATVEQRARMSRLLANKYPTLGPELLELFASQYPEAIGEVSGYVDHLIKTRYPEIPGVISAELQKAPAVQSTVEQLIIEKYPALVDDLHEIPEGEDLQVYVARLIQTKYPGLLKDVLATVTSKFSPLLVSVQHKVISSHPEILIDVARMVQKKYPRLTNDALILVLTKYPDLMPSLVAVLNSPSTPELADTRPGDAAVPGAPAPAAQPPAAPTDAEAPGDSAPEPAPED